MKRHETTEENMIMMMMVMEEDESSRYMIYTKCAQMRHTDAYERVKKIIVREPLSSE